MQKRLEFVNQQLSMDRPEDDIPVSDTPDEPVPAEPTTVKVGMVSVAMPAMAYTDRPKPQIPVAPDDKPKSAIHKIKR